MDPRGSHRLGERAIEFVAPLIRSAFPAEIAAIDVQTNAYPFRSGLAGRCTLSDAPGRRPCTPRCEGAVSGRLQTGSSVKSAVERSRLRYPPPPLARSVLSAP